jgi:CDP-paratose 2-epimerase
MTAVDQRATEQRPRAAPRNALIIGGAGFIGSALADTLLREGWQVRLLDNLAGRRSAANLAWLQMRHPGFDDVAIADADDWLAVNQQMIGSAAVFHLVAADPRAGVTGPPGRSGSSSLTTAATIVDAAAAQPERPVIVVASSHGAYGPLDDIELIDAGSRFEPLDRTLARQGIDEAYVGAVANGPAGWQAITDRYALARAQREGLPVTVLRFGSVYGPRQLRGPDDGIADHLSSVLKRQSPVVKGDPRRVRDVLYIQDAVDALVLAATSADRLAGELFNVGGGARNALSVLERHELMQQIAENSVPLEHHRALCVGDQRWYVSDHRRFSALTGWEPATTAPWGLALLAEAGCAPEGSGRLDWVRS